MRNRRSCRYCIEIRDRESEQHDRRSVGWVEARNPTL